MGGEVLDLMPEALQYGGSTTAARGVLLTGSLEATECEADRDERLGKNAFALRFASSSTYWFYKKYGSHGSCVVVWIEGIGARRASLNTVGLYVNFAFHGLRPRRSFRPSSGVARRRLGAPPPLLSPATLDPS